MCHCGNYQARSDITPYISYISLIVNFRNGFFKQHLAVAAPKKYHEGLKIQLFISLLPTDSVILVKINISEHML